MSALTFSKFALWRKGDTLTATTVASMPSITITAISSIKVNPFFIINLILVCSFAL